MVRRGADGAAWLSSNCFACRNPLCSAMIAVFLVATLFLPMFRPARLMAILRMALLAPMFHTAFSLETFLARVTSARIYRLDVRRLGVDRAVERTYRAFFPSTECRRHPRNQVRLQLEENTVGINDPGTTPVGVSPGFLKPTIGDGATIFLS